MREADVGLTIPVLHDTFHDITHDVVQYPAIQALYAKEIEKINNELGDKEKIIGTRYSAP
jgi:hypothetical protein